jgi:hypothetical protein
VPFRSADPQDEHILWVGTNGGGLEPLRQAHRSGARYSTTEGLPNNVVYGILADDEATPLDEHQPGISRFDPRTGTFRNFDASDGLQSDEFNRYAYCKTRWHALLRWGQGLQLLPPEGLQDDSTASAIRITGIKLINRPIDLRAPKDHRSPCRPT